MIEKNWTAPLPNSEDISAANSSGLPRVPWEKPPSRASPPPPNLDWSACRASSAKLVSGTFSWSTRSKNDLDSLFTIHTWGLPLPHVKVERERERQIRQEEDQV